MKITKEIIKAMKSSDSFIVRMEFIGNDTMEQYKGILELVEKEKKNHKTGWIKPEKRTTFDLGHCWFNSLRVNGSMWKSYVSVSLWKSGIWQLLPHILKENDDLTFWVSDNQNQYMKASTILTGALENLPHESYDGLHMDCLWLRIERKGVMLADYILVDYTVAPNNSARGFHY